MFLIGWIAKLLIARGISEKKAGPMSWLIALAAAALLLFGGWQLVKRSIIRNNDAVQEAQVAGEQLKRTHNADTVDDKLEQRDQVRDSNVKGAIEDAVDKDPKHGAAPAGPVSNAAADELRRQRERRQR